MGAKLTLDGRMVLRAQYLWITMPLRLFGSGEGGFSTRFRLRFSPFFPKLIPVTTAT